MARIRHPALVCVLTAVLIAACAPQGRPSVPSGAAEPPRIAPKRLTAAIMAEQQSLGPASGKGPGKASIEGLLHAGFSDQDETGTLRAKLAEAVPSVQNGLWQILPDGRMATTWKIRPGSLWHDGTPFTSEDILFTTKVEQSKDLAAFRNLAYDWVEAVEAPDARTVVVRWKQPYIQADQMFGFPLPKHLLQEASNGPADLFLQHPYWSTEFIGTGPYKLKEWDRSVGVSLVANDAYVLGRPKIDELVVRFIADPNALVANILAGAVDLPLGRGLSVEQALQIRDQWKDGRVEVLPRNWITLYPQLYYTNPPILKDVRMRRALLHAINRQEMVETLAYGYGAVAHSILNPGQARYRDAETRLPHYDYDPQRAGALIEELGHARGPDGVYRDAAGQKLHIELRGVPTDLSTKATLTVANYWQQVGVDAEGVLMTPAQQRDSEYRAVFPAFELVRNPNDVDALRNFHSSRLRTRENNWIGNHTGHQNPEYDALYEKYLVTIPIMERADLVGRMVYFIADQVIALGLFYDTLPVFVGRRVTNFKVSSLEGSDQIWSAHEWDVAS